jgi:hypothetical protein
LTAASAATPAAPPAARPFQSFWSLPIKDSPEPGV